MDFFFLSFFRKRVVEWWHGLSSDWQDWLKGFVSFLVNDLFTSFLVSFPLWLLFGWSFWAVFVSVACFVPVFEHYYVWFRRDWKGSD